jgi:hypothetical protein
VPAVRQKLHLASCADFRDRLSLLQRLFNSSKRSRLHPLLMCPDVRSKTLPVPLQLRSLALLLFIFGASAALAAYVGLKYEELTPEPAIRSTQPLAPPSPSASDGPSSPKKPSASPTTESTQTRMLGSPAAFEQSNPQDMNRPASDAQQAVVPNAVDGLNANAGEALKCNPQACSNAYRSFDAADCTYQPANGPRRACRK